MSTYVNQCFVRLSQRNSGKISHKCFRVSRGKKYKTASYRVWAISHALTSVPDLVWRYRRTRIQIANAGVRWPPSLFALDLKLWTHITVKTIYDVLKTHWLLKYPIINHSNIVRTIQTLPKCHSYASNVEKSVEFVLGYSFRFSNFFIFYNILFTSLHLISP